MAATATIKFPSKWAEVAAQSHGGVGLPNLAEASDVRREVETVGNPPQPNNPPQALLTLKNTFHNFYHLPRALKRSGGIRSSCFHPLDSRAKIDELQEVALGLLKEEVLEPMSEACSRPFDDSLVVAGAGDGSRGPRSSIGVEDHQTS